MDIKQSDEETLLLDSVDNEIALTGRTNKKCSRCGNDIILEQHGKSYVIRCKTDDCIYLGYRGI